MRTVREDHVDAVPNIGHAIARVIRPEEVTDQTELVSPANLLLCHMATELDPAEGIIGLQSETAEIFYRNIEIKEFDEIIPIEELLNE